MEQLKMKAAALKREIFALYLAVRDPRTPWYAKIVVLCVVAYALSPIDLIPDPIPVLGLLDDLVLLPLGIYLALKLIPQEVVTDCRGRAASAGEKLPRNWYAAAVIIILWLSALVLAAYFVIGWVSPNELSDERLGYKTRGEKPRTNYRPFPFEILANPSGLTVTSLPGWVNISFATVGEISLPNKQKRLPLGY
jgi:uncharacterized membrane protein YkvA (DUF1232 family)